MSADNDQTTDASTDDHQTDHRETRTSRRTFLGSMAAAGAVGAGLGTGTAAATLAENLTWNFEMEEYDLFPDDPSCSKNALVHAEEQFDDSTTVTEVNDSGCDLDTTWNTSSVTIENNCSSAGEDWLLPWSNIPQDVPSFALYATIDSMSSGSEAAVGIYNDSNNHVEARISQIDGNISVVERIGGSTTETELQSSAPSAPVDVLVNFMGAPVAVNYRDSGGVWQYAGWTDLGTDFYDTTWTSNFAPGVGAYLQANESLTVSQEYVLSTQQFGYRDPFLVTHKDGAPMVESDQYIYMCWSAGAPELQFGATNVYKIDILNHTMELVGRIQYNTKSGKIYPDYPTKIIWDDDTSEFIVVVSGWVTFTGGPDDKCHAYVTRTTNNVLEGLHVLTMSDTNLPGTGSSHVYDVDLYYDSGTGTWRGCANETNGKFNSVETADDSLTSGWSVLDTFDPTRPRVVEGGRVRKVDGERVTFFADELAPETMRVSNFPDISNDVQDVTTNSDRYTGNLPSHPQVVEIQDSNANETSYRLFTFGQRVYEDMGTFYSEGELLEFEAQEVNSGLEYSTHSFPSGVGAASSSGCSTSTAISEGTYSIEAVHSGKPAEVNGQSTSSGANVQQWSDNGGNHQEWEAILRDDGTFTFSNNNSGLVMDGGGTSSGSSLDQEDWGSSDLQRWDVIENSDGTYRIKNVTTGLVATVKDGSTGDGADIIQKSWSDVNHQKWTFNLL